MSRFGVTLVTKRNCSLCARAEPLVEAWARRTRAHVVRVLIEEDEALAARFSTRVPVVLDGTGQVLDEGRISSWRLGPAMIRAKLLVRSHRPSQPPG